MKEGEMEGKERWKPYYEGRGNGRKGRERKEGEENISRSEGKVEAMI